MRFRFSFILFVLFAFLLVLSITAVAAPGQKGVIALKGAAATSFHLPSDAHLVQTRSMNNRGLVARRYQQMVGDAEVLGGQLTVLSQSTGEVLAITGAHFPNLMSTNDIKLKGNAAQAVAVARIGGEGQWKTRLMINPVNGRFFYIVENQRSDSRWFHWIDAENGSVVNAYNGLTTSDGIGVQGDIKDLTSLTSPQGGFYVLSANDGRQITYDAEGKPRLPGSLATDDDDHWNQSGSTSPGQPALVDAQFYARATDNYLKDTHGFNWTDHYSQGMVSSAHVKHDYNNAYWNGSQMAYGDGDGTSFIEFSGDLDVVGHELSHGVTEATSNLIYQNESGALNEAFSDIMGTNIEFATPNNVGNWTIGEDITVGSNGIRNMANPNEDGDPSHYADLQTGTYDNGYVHSNSGIANHWYYLLVMGGQNANPSRASGTDVVGIGQTKAEQIAFLGFTGLNATADFCAARASTVAVAGADQSNVIDAWDEVGVTETVCTSGSSGGSGGTSGGTAPVISNVASKSLKGVKFQISWSTDIPATTEVTFTCCGTYTKTDLVTSHAYNFTGSKGSLYEFYVTSDDGNGNASTDGPYYYQN